MKMLNWIIEKARTQGADQVKAHQHLSKSAKENFRNIMRGYDAFVQHMERVMDPSIFIGMAKDSMGNDIPVRIPTRDMHRNRLVQGATGSGKTTFVTWDFAQALRLGYPAGMADCKNDLFDTGLRWAGAMAYCMEPSARAQFVRSLLVMNPFSDALVPSNFLKFLKELPGNTAEMQTYQVCGPLSRVIQSDSGFQMENIQKNAVLLAMESGLTLVEVPLIIHDELLRNVLVNHSANTALKEFFLRDYPSIPASSKLALLTRIQNFLLPENVRLMVGADDLIDWKGVLDRGQPFFIFLGKGPGVPEEQVEVLGSLILQFLFQGVFNAGGKRRPYQIIMDEFFHLINAPGLEKRFTTALTTFRSFGVQLTLVMHNFSQVPDALRESILNNCDYMVIFRTHFKNARFFGDFLPELDPEIMREWLNKTGRPPPKNEVHAQLLARVQQLPNRHCYFYDKQKPYRALLLRVPDVPSPEQALGITEKALDDFMREEGIFVGGYALPKEELRRQIEARRARLEALIRPPPIHLTSASLGNESGRTSGAKAAGRRRKPKLG